MLDIVSALPDAREGVRRLSQVLSGVVVNARTSDVRLTSGKSASGSFTSTSTPGTGATRLLSSDDAQLAQESVDRLAALIALGPPRVAGGGPVADGSGGGGSGKSVGGSMGGSTSSLLGGGLESLPEGQAEQYLTEMYDMLLRCRVPEALGELTALAGSALLGSGSQQQLGQPAGGNSRGDEITRHEEQQRRRSIDLQRSLDMYVRDGGPSPARASIEGLLCGHKLGGHAQALLESISQLLLSCVFDPIWRHRDLLAQPRVRDMIQALTCSQLLPAFAAMCVKLRIMLSKPAIMEAASYVWLLGFVARCFTGLCRCMKAMVEFESCSHLWAQLGDAFTAQLSITRFIERFSATIAAVHPSYMMWRPPPPPGMPPDGGLGVASAALRPGDTYLEMCTAVEVFLEGLFHLTWHHTARAEEAAAAGPPPPLLVRDVLAAMEPEGSGSVADLLAAAATAAARGAAANGVDGRPGPAGLLALLGSSVAGANGAWPGLVSGPATHALATDWLAHVVARLDGGELLVSGTTAAAAGPGSEGGGAAAAADANGDGPREHHPGPLLHRPGPVDRDELPLLLSVCLAVAAVGGSHYITKGGLAAAQRQLLAAQQAAARSAPSEPGQGPAPSRRRSIELFFGAGAGASTASGAEGMSAGLQQLQLQHANKLLRLTVRGLKVMAAAQDAELAPYPAIHSAHACAVEMHKLLQGEEVLAGSRGAAAGGSGGGPGDYGAGGGGAGVAATPAFWPFVPAPPQHTSLLLDAFQSSLLCYSAFLHPDPDKDPLTLRAVERCHEQLLELCTATGEGLRAGVASVAYAAHAGLLPALEGVLRAAALTCRLETTRVLLTAVLSSAPALQQLMLSRDGYLFLTLRKLVIACINLACPHPLEHPAPPVQHPTARQSLTVILQQCSGGGGGAAGAAAAAAAAATRAECDAASFIAARRAALEAATGGRGSVEVPRLGTTLGRPLILPLAVELLETVAMLAGRFIEVHEGRVAAAASIRVDRSGNVTSGGPGNQRDGDGDGGDEDGDEDDDGAAAEARHRRSFEREATELLPLAQLLPFALWWLGAPLSDLLDALAQEVINDNGSGSLYGGAGAGGAAQEAPVPRSHHPRAASNSSPNLHLPDAKEQKQQQQPAKPQQPQQVQQLQRSEMRRRQSVEMPRGNLAAKPVGKGGGIVGLLGGGGNADATPSKGATAAAGGAAQQSQSPPSPPQPVFPATPPAGGGGAAAAWPQPDMVLSHCADMLHTLFRLTVALSDLNRRAPHPDWSALIASLQPQQLVARAVQVLVHGIQRQRANNNRLDSNGRHRSRPHLAHPVLLSSLLSACVCGVQSGWLGPHSFGIPSATADPADAEQPAAAPPPPPAAGSAAGAAGGGAGGPVYGPLFSRVRRFTVISANPEGRAYQWAMIGDEDEEGAPEEAPEGDSESAIIEGEEHEAAEGEAAKTPRRPPVVLLQAAAPGGAWSNLPPPPGPAVVPTRALQVLVSEYGSAADKVLFDLLLRGLANKRNNTTAAAAAAAAAAAGGPPSHTPPGDALGGPDPDEKTFFWVPPSRSLRLRTCSNPCCMNLSGLHEAQLRLAPCPRCSQEWYCSRHCQAMHWHVGHKNKCAK